MTTEAVDAACGMLAQTEQPRGGRTVEELVTELIRPMLKTWLDDNLPSLVEGLVPGRSLLVTAMRDADHMAKGWGHDAAIIRLAYMKRHLEQKREAEIERASRARLNAEQEDRAQMHQTPSPEPPQDLSAEEDELWRATVDGMKAIDLVNRLHELLNKLDAQTSASTTLKKATAAG